HSPDTTGHLQDRNLERHLSRRLAESGAENIAGCSCCDVFDHTVAVDLLVHPYSRVPLVETGQARLRQRGRWRKRESHYWGRTWTLGGYNGRRSWARDGRRMRY